jgi:hypothetical protein
VPGEVHRRVVGVSQSVRVVLKNAAVARQRRILPEELGGPEGLDGSGLYDGVYAKPSCLKELWLWLTIQGRRNGGSGISPRVSIFVGAFPKGETEWKAEAEIEAWSFMKEGTFNAWLMGTTVLYYSGP